MKRREVVHSGDVGRPLHEGEALAGLLHPGVEVSDDRLGPADHLSLKLDLKPEHPMGRRMLGTHVDDHALVLGQLVVERVVVLDDDPALLLQPGRRLLLLHLLGALVGRGDVPQLDLFWFFAARDPEIQLLAELSRGSASLPAEEVSSVSLVVIRSPCGRL